MSVDLEGKAFRRHGNALVPSDEHSDEFLRGIPEGKELLVSIRRVRSLQHNKFFFKLLDVVIQNTDKWHSADELLDALKLATGHVERRANLDGIEYLAPKSINFATLDEEAFKRFKERCVYLLATRVLGCDPVELLEEVDGKRVAYTEST